MQLLIEVFLLILLTFSTSLFGVVGVINAQEISTECKGVYSDIQLDNKMCHYVEYLYHQEVASGSNGRFMPNDGITRGQVSKMIVNAFQISENLAGEEFPDIQSEHTFYKDIMSLRNADIVDGFADGEFKSDELVTRAQVVKLIVNAINSSKDNLISIEQDSPELSMFDDVSTDHSLFEFISSAYSVGNDEEDNKKIINGYPDGTFRPDQSMKRIEVAKVITNSMKFGEFENVDCEEWFCGDRWVEPLERIQSSNNILFFANSSYSDNSFDVNFYDANTKDIFYKKTIITLDPLLSNLKGDKNSIVLDTARKNIYYLTSGGMSGQPTDDVRLYATNLESGTEMLLADFGDIGKYENSKIFYDEINHKIYVHLEDDDYDYNGKFFVYDLYNQDWYRVLGYSPTGISSDIIINYDEKEMYSISGASIKSLKLPINKGEDIRDNYSSTGFLEVGSVKVSSDGKYVAGCGDCQIGLFNTLETGDKWKKIDKWIGQDASYNCSLLFDNDKYLYFLDNDKVKYYDLSSSKTYETKITDLQEIKLIETIELRSVSDRFLLYSHYSDFWIYDLKEQETSLLISEPEMILTNLM